MSAYNNSIAIMCLSRTVSEINDDFSGTSQIFPTPVYLIPPVKGFPAFRVKNYNDGATGPRKEFDDIFIQT